ncbi:hypothetical protein RJ639_042785 [Escallonia herrerae]|uniref:Uncharacterized protein n=1 Tax=Escallonia herrerae TaxID=1293975 RepID=A0AA88WDR0_9ASTE|nr:hypothetical protein RJ639_042785 [Escallonia herrerae]
MAYEKWEWSNCISLIILKGSIRIAIYGAITDSENVKLYFAHIEEQFQGSSKAHATTLITKMVMLKFCGSGGVCEHILRINDMDSQLKGLGMEISEDPCSTSGGSSMYTTSSRSPFRKAYFTSNCRKDQSRFIATDMRMRIILSLATNTILLRCICAGSMVSYPQLAKEIIELKNLYHVINA